MKQSSYLVEAIKSVLSFGILVLALVIVLVNIAPEYPSVKQAIIEFRQSYWWTLIIPLIIYMYYRYNIVEKPKSPFDISKLD